MKANQLFTPEIKAQLVSAIEQAELSTSGEIRLHIDNYCKGDVLDRAATVFETLQMHKTELRNGVLFYVAHCDKKFAVLGDSGINQKVPANFWDEIKEQVLSQFKVGKYAEGLSAGIIKAGDQLKVHFPYQKEDKNELTNEISVGND